MNRQAILQSLKRPLQVGLAVGIAAAILTLFIPDRYTSQASILPSASRSGGALGRLAAAATTFGVALPGGGDNEDSYPDILASRWMAERLLQQEYSFGQRSWRFGSETRRKETLASLIKAPNPDRAIQRLQQMLIVKQDVKTKLLSISVTTRSPELSQQVCQRAVALLNDFVVNQSRTRGGNKAAFARQRMEDAQKEQAEAEAAFRSFLAGNRNYQDSADPDTRLRGMKLASALQLRTQVLSTLALSLEQALMEEKNDMPILNVVDRGNLPSEKSKPSRSRIVLMVFFLAACATGAWQQRQLLQAWLLQSRGKGA